MLPCGAPEPKLLDVERPKDRMWSCLLHHDSHLPDVLQYVQSGKLAIYTPLTIQTADVSNVMPIVSIDMHMSHLQNPQNKLTARAYYVYMPNTVQYQKSVMPP